MTDKTRPPLTPLAQSLPRTVPFVGPETQERQSGISFSARIGANESGFGPAPSAIRAMEASVAGIWQYADPESHDLRQAIAEHHGVGMENVVIGEGIDGLLGLTVRLYVRAGVHVVTSAGAYPTFNYHVNGYGGTLHLVPFADDHEDPAQLLETARITGARLIYFSNPDNPMGTWHDASAVQAMIDEVPEQALLLLDEAYVETAPDGTSPEIDVSNPNVLRYRTFSKAYGMAGARIGYVIGEAETIQGFEKVRNHFGLNRTAQIGALAALQDGQYLQDIRSKVEASRSRIGEIAMANGLKPIGSAANFVAIDCGRDTAYAKAVLAGLGEQGIFVRMPGVEPLSRCIRVSCGPEREMELFAEALPRVLTA